MIQNNFVYTSAFLLALTFMFTAGCSEKEASDPGGTTPPTSCEELFTCGVDCNDSEDATTCWSECREATTPEIAAQVDAYSTCVLDCYDLEDDEVDGCIAVLCDPLYIECVLPQKCRDGCVNFSEACREGFISSNRRHRYYWSAGTQKRVYESLGEVVIEWRKDTDSLPQKITGVSEMTHYTSLVSRNMTKVTLANEPAASESILQVLGNHAAVAAIYPVFTTPDDRILMSTNEVVARFSSPQHLETALTKLKGIELKKIREVSGLENTWILTSRAIDALVTADRLITSGIAKWAHPNFVRLYASRRVPNDPYFSHQWHLHNAGDQEGHLAGADIRAVEAWDINFGSNDVIIAINDSGIDLGHSDFRFLRDTEGNKITVGAPDDIDGALVEGCCSHGTSVAGIASATGDNGIGTAGVCPMCTTLPVFLTKGQPDFVAWDMTDAEIAEAFTEASAAGSWVINNSWGAWRGEPSVLGDETPGMGTMEDVGTDAIITSLDLVATTGRGGRGVSIVWSAGNDNESVNTDELVSHPNVIGVAAVDSSGRKASYSNFGESIWVAAPEVKVTSDSHGNFGYEKTGAEAFDPSGNTTDDFGGTSSAAPVVSGVLGLMYSANADLRASQAKDILRRTSRKIDLYYGNYAPDADGFLRSPYYGYGLVDAHAAVRAALMGCSDASTELCEPATSCADGPLENVPEVCNGVDDDCDGNIDEDVCLDALSDCEACDLTSTCDGGCTHLPDDPTPSCLRFCSGDTPCAEGYTCSGGLCMPNDGRCSEPSAEVCDGRDNDANGLIDDGACSQWGVICQYDTECPEGFVCQEKRCFKGCDGPEDCSDSEVCRVRADRYAQPLETSVCTPPWGFVTGSCIEGCLYLYENYSEPVFDAIAGCVEEAKTCRAAKLCVGL